MVQGLVAFKNSSEVRVSTVEEAEGFTDLLAEVMKTEREDRLKKFSRATGPATHWKSFTDLLTTRTRPLGPTHFMQRVDNLTLSNSENIMIYILKHYADSDVRVIVYDAELDVISHYG